MPASDVTRLIDTFVCFQLSVVLHRIGISHRLFAPLGNPVCTPG
jgi:hypothetical protein